MQVHEAKWLFDKNGIKLNSLLDLFHSSQFYISNRDAWIMGKQHLQYIIIAYRYSMTLKQNVQANAFVFLD